MIVEETVRVDLDAARAGGRLGFRRVTRRRQMSYWWYLAPIGIGFVVIVAAPFAFNIFSSFFNWKGGSAPLRWYGWGNYADLLQDDVFWQSFVNTLYMVIAIVVIPTLLGLIIAAVLFDYIGRRFGDRAASFLRATFYLPQILPIAIAGVLWSWILGARDGAVNSTLRAIGIENPPDWLGDPDLALGSVMLVLVWLQIGYPVIIFMAALQRVDPELYEAAELDGANWWQRFMSITLAQIRPDVFVIVLTATVESIKVFAPILILTQGGPEGSTITPSFYAYRNFFNLSRVGYGATIATTMTIMIVIVVVLLLWWQSRQDKAREEWL